MAAVIMAANCLGKIGAALDEAEAEGGARKARLLKEQEEALTALRAAEETAKRAQKDLEEQERAIVEDARRAEEARLAIERKWFEGVRPECRPSDEDITRMKAQYHYGPGFIHIAVVAHSSTFWNLTTGRYFDGAQTCSQLQHCPPVLELKASACLETNEVIHLAACP